MLILSKNTDKALPLLHQVRVQRAHCTLFVFGDSDAMKELASKADVRAENHPYRKVVWVPDPQVLYNVPEFSVLQREHEGGAIAATMTFDFRLSSVRKANDTIDLVAIEQSFIDAEMGTP